MAGVVILGIFVGDAAFRSDRMPVRGETVLGSSFALGPGGKGSNQAVACARMGGETHFVTKLGQDDFAELAFKTWAEAGVTPHVEQDPNSYTGAACIMIDDATGDNAIIVTPGAAATLNAADMDAKADLIESASVFVTDRKSVV